MKPLLGMIVAVVVAAACGQSGVSPEVKTVPAATEIERPEWRRVIHGGAGGIAREDVTEEQEAA